jgi:cell division protein ZapA (FtsZ GTPase activity inhibitor)|tara:strand:+ start:160 stop:459 length:300 start_codon:yes stop_codon:yes gene_type:complete
MNDEQKILFAEMVADLVVDKLTSQFNFKLDDHREISDVTFEDLFDDYFAELSDDTEEQLIGELARLTTLLAIYEDKEQYEKAKIIKKKLQILNKKLDNL